MRFITVILCNLIVGCAGSAVLIDSLVKRSTLAPIGSTRIFEVTATVESDEGIEMRSEVVKAKVRGYIRSKTVESYSLYYTKEGEILFENKLGDRLIIYNKRPQGLFVYGSFSKARLEYSNGKILNFESALNIERADKTVASAIPYGRIWAKGAVKDYGFRLLKYKVEDKGVNR